MRLTHAVLGAGTIATAVGLTACAADDPSTRATTEQPSAQTAAPATQSASPSGANAYADGEYSATGWYGSLPSHHDVTLTIADDTVTDVQITTPAEDETSLGYQQRFAQALPGVIVGRNIDELNVDRVAGSSGCSEGFMDALAQIKADAAA